MNTLAGRVGAILPRLQWFVAAAAFGVFGFVLADTIEERQKNSVLATLAKAADRYVAELTAQMSTAIYASRGVAALASVDPDFITENYDQIVSELVENDPNIINVALAPDLVVSHVYPLERNAQVIGLNIGNLETGQDVVRRAIQERQTVVAGPMETLQGVTSFITRTPVYIEDPGSDDGTRLWGLVSVVVATDAVLGAAGLKDSVGLFDVSVDGKDALGSDGATFFGGASADATDQQQIVGERTQRSVKLPGGEWVVTVSAGEQIAAASSRERNALLFGYFVFCSLCLIGFWIVQQQSQRAKQAEDLFENAVNSIADGFVIYDADDRFVVCNDAYRDLYELSQDLFVPGTPFSTIVRIGAQRGQYADAVGREEEWIAERMKTHLAADSENIQQIADGRWLKISERRTPQGYIVGFRVDVTEVIEARRQAEEAYRVKSEFISVLSHELRTPLTIILGYAKVLSNLHLMKTVKDITGMVDSKEQDHAVIGEAFERLVRQTADQGMKIERSGTHLLTLINDLLDYSKIEAGKMELKLETFSLKGMIGKVVEDMTDFAAEKNNKLIDISRDVMVTADQIRIKQVLINIIGNAIKFTDAGTIEISTEIENDLFRLIISDTGCGIPHDALEGIFDAFQQVDFSDKRRAGGTGLGLAICNSIVSLHGGRLLVSSDVGAGSRFTVELPLQAEDVIYESDRRPSVLSAVA